MPRCPCLLPRCLGSDPLTMENSGRLIAVGHVEIQAPPGIEAELCWFYGRWLGLEEVQNDQPSNGHPVLRFRSERLELRIRLLHQPQIESIDGRVRFAVPSLESAADTLKENAYEFQWLRGLSWTDRMLVLADPAGNRIIVRQNWPPGPF